MVEDVGLYLRVLARAEASTGDGDWAEAAPLWEQVTTANPVNGSYWARLAEARFGLEDYAAALPAYQRTLELGVRPPQRAHETFPGDMPYLIPSEIAYSIACCHARLGNDQRAVDALAAALDRGFRDLDRARTDEHWQSLRDDKRLRELLGIIDADDLSRDQGWRGDVRFLAREIKRRAFAPFALISEQEFDRQVAELERQVPDLTDAQLIVGMMRLVRHLDDGHAYVTWPKAREDLALMLPLDLFQFPEGVFVIAAAPRYRQLVGARVDRIGGHAVAEVLAAIDPLITRDNEQQVSFVAPVRLLYTALLQAIGLTDDPAAAALAVRFADGSAGTVTVAGAPRKGGLPHSYEPDWIALTDTLPTPVPLHLRAREVAYWFEYLPEADLVYFKYNGIRDHPAEPFAAFCDRLFGLIETRRPGRLVIDMRWNPGGNTFLAQPLLHHLIGCRAVNRRGALYVIIGRFLFSAAQNTATAIERETQAIFVGEPTGSRPNFIGESIPFELPYSKVRVNAADLYWQTSWPNDHRTWIAPQIYAPPTFEAFSQNRDPAMEAILAIREQLPGS
jgi:hypothetical protein